MEDRSCGSRDMFADRQTQTQTDKTDCNTPLPYWSGVITVTLCNITFTVYHTLSYRPTCYRTLYLCIKYYTPELQMETTYEIVFCKKAHVYFSNTSQWYSKLRITNIASAWHCMPATQLTSAVANPAEQQSMLTT